MAYDVAVIGGGPGGYVAAIRAAQNGLKTALFEKDKLGGVCLNKGCIPTKALLKSASVLHSALQSREFGINDETVSFDWPAIMERKQAIVNQLVGGIGSLIRSNKIDFINEEATLKDAQTVVAGGREYGARNIILATGSAPVFPPIDGIGQKIVLTSDEALCLNEVPKNMVMIGGGVIGLEFAFMLNRFGTKVTIVEMLDNIIAVADDDVIKAVARDLQKSGIRIVTGAMVKKIQENAVVYKKNGKDVSVEADCVLVSTGRRPVTDTAMLDKIGIKHKKGMIETDERMHTNVAGIYAIGDVNGKMMLAHTASKEGIVAVENVCGVRAKMDYSIIPQCIYTEPEVAWVGMTEKQAKDAGRNFAVGRFPMAANGKSLIEGETTGFVKVIADKKYGEILGAHMYCPHATDMIEEAVLAMKTECCMEDIANCIHPHPTVSEAVMEAANAVFGTAIHIPK